MKMSGKNSIFSWKIFFFFLEWIKTQINSIFVNLLEGQEEEGRQMAKTNIRQITVPIRKK